MFSKKQIKLKIIKKEQSQTYWVSLEVNNNKKKQLKAIFTVVNKYQLEKFFRVR